MVQMPNSRRARAKQLLQQSKTLLFQVREDMVLGRFGSNDLRMKAYNDLIDAASQIFPEDHILNGQMVIMPDAVLQMYMPDRGGFLPFATMPPELPSQRTEVHLSRLVNRIEILLGEEPAQQPLDTKDFMFIADQKLRDVLRLDFIEAQKSFSVEAYKACGLLCGSLIEGMLLDIVQKRSDQCIDQDTVGMTKLIETSSKLGLLSQPVSNFAKGARDVRDTVHPRAEIRQGHRASRDEAEILLQLVSLIYNELNTSSTEKGKQ